MNYAGFIFISVIIAGFIGWIMNIVTIFHSGPIAEWTATTIVRIIGVFIAPIGAVLGWF
ncbi:MAG: hypothetical protein RSE62_12925 [Citrobacter sp.]